MQQLQQESKTHNRREYNLDSTTLIDMFRAILTIASLVGAAAFAPVSQVARSSALKMSFESEIGAQPPLGFWDPLGLLDDADQARFDRLRCVENKHGRISMLAILGHLVTSAGIYSFSFFNAFLVTSLILVLSTLKVSDCPAILHTVFHLLI